MDWWGLAALVSLVAGVVLGMALAPQVPASTAKVIRSPVALLPAVVIATFCVVAAFSHIFF